MDTIKLAGLPDNWPYRTVAMPLGKVQVFLDDDEPAVRSPKVRALHTLTRSRVKVSAAEIAPASRMTATFLPKPAMVCFIERS